MFKLELVCYCWKMQLLGKPKACESMRDYGLILGLFAFRILHIVEPFVCSFFMVIFQCTHFIWVVLMIIYFAKIPRSNPDCNVAHSNTGEKKESFDRTFINLNCLFLILYEWALTEVMATGPIGFGDYTDLLWWK